MCRMDVIVKIAFYIVKMDKISVLIILSLFLSLFLSFHILCISLTYHSPTQTNIDVHVALCP